ncbi:MAG: hypothetical protein HKP58_18765 [Desulfatitalea sp.]|nr:hypothetical protein [Desulfatitalea sp.]NNK02458.1 hypothetical protein [Desulfatitalea sp.]
MQVHIDAKIEKHLQTLRRSGKKAALAAQRAEAIIERMRASGIIPERVGNITKHGELRIKGVMKYDLGNGYRLITYKQGKRLFVLYAGSHDGCHQWIENNRELTVDQIQERCAELPVCTETQEERSETSEAMDTEEMDDLLTELTEKELRRLFCGLVETRRAE